MKKIWKKTIYRWISQFNEKKMNYIKYHSIYSMGVGLNYVPFSIKYFATQMQCSGFNNQTLESFTLIRWLQTIQSYYIFNFKFKFDSFINFKLYFIWFWMLMLAKCRNWNIINQSPIFLSKVFLLWNRTLYISPWQSLFSFRQCFRW